MTKSRIEYPGTIIHERDPENHFRFQDVGMREYYHDVIRRIPGLMGFEGKALHIGCGAAAFENLLREVSRAGTVAHTSPYRRGHIIAVRILRQDLFKNVGQRSFALPG
jgi:hypothetical protein